MPNKFYLYKNTLVCDSVVKYIYKLDIWSCNELTPEFHLVGTFCFKWNLLMSTFFSYVVQDLCMVNTADLLSAYTLNGNSCMRVESLSHTWALLFNTCALLEISFRCPEGDFLLIFRVYKNILKCFTSLVIFFWLNDHRN